MKIALLLLASFLFGFGSVFSQTGVGVNDSSANCLTYWRQGETKTYFIVHDKSTIQPGQPDNNIRFEYEADVAVLDATEKDYTMRWVFHLPADLKALRPGLADSLPVFEGMQMIFRTSEMGAFIELVNWEEVRDDYVKMMELSLPKHLDSTAKAAITASKRMFNNKAAVESALIKEIQLFHLPYGYTFTKTKMSAETNLSNPYGGAPLPAIQSFQITQLSPYQFTLVVRQDIDQGGAKGIFDAMIKKMNLKDPVALAEIRDAVKNMVISDYTEYEFSRPSGWLRHLSYTRTAVTGSVKQSDGYTIDLKN